MTIKRNLFAGGIITVLTVVAFTVERGLGRKSKAGRDVERQLRILSGANGVVHTQTGQASEIVAKPEISGRAGYPLYR